MASIFLSSTYHLYKPFRSSLARGFFVFLFFLLFLIGIAQWVGQSSLSASLPPPVIDEGVPSFSVKLNYLDAFVRRYGKVDCLLLGSSHIHNGLDPVIIEQVYREQTGYEIHCFNFGLGTLTTDTAGPLLSALVKKYQPSLVIFEVSARSFSSDFGDLTQPLQNNSWIRYQNNEKSLKGWALEYLYGYRYYLALKTWQYPYNRSIMLNNWRASNERGFAPILVTDSMNETTIQNIQFKIAKSNWDGFMQLLSLQEKTQLVIIESPLQESYLSHYLVGGIAAYERDFIQPVQQELSMRGILFWRGVKDVSPILSDGMWYDNRHVNAEGAKIFSHWLGEKMAQEILPESFR